MERDLAEHELQQVHAPAAEARQHRRSSTVEDFQRWQGMWRGTQDVHCGLCHECNKGDVCDVVVMQVGVSPEHGPRTKAIVFTQFWHHLFLIEQQLTEHGIGVAVLKGKMKPDEKARALNHFKVGLQPPSFIVLHGKLP